MFCVKETKKISLHLLAFWYTPSGMNIDKKIPMKKSLTNPSEFAREALLTLAARKIQPTPENYAKIYAEISGIPTEESNGAEKVLRAIVDNLARTPRLLPSSTALKGAIDADDWGQCMNEIEKVLPQVGQRVDSWSALIRDLLRQLEINHKGVTVSRKKASLQTVLTKFASNPDVLFGKLEGLMRSWTEPVVEGSLAKEPTGEIDLPPATPGRTTIIQSLNEDSALLSIFPELLAQTMESTLNSYPEFTNEIRLLAMNARSSKTHDEVLVLSKKIRQFCMKIETSGADKIKIHEGLLRILRLLVQNISEMVEDKEWLTGQVVILQGVIANPVDRRAVADAERCLREIIIKQGNLRQSMLDAETTLKNLMTTFIGQLSELNESTADYQKKMEDYSLGIGQSGNIAELGGVLDSIIQDTRIIQSATSRSQSEMTSAQQRAADAEQKINRLETELEQINELVREDQLTGALNRRGLDEAFKREATRADRQASPLCVALLDIDNFKLLNDTLGHHAGDQALIHLSRTIKEAMRPTDWVARYGGEEFVILLPGVEVAEAVDMIQRLQRDLTKKFFLSGAERRLITFSAGVSIRAPNEDQEEVVGRADKGMYQAKKTGKNRVVACEPLDCACPSSVSTLK